MRLLVVDDDPVVRMAVRLHMTGHDVVEATTVAGALDDFADEHPEVVLLDRRLSTGDEGLDFVSEMRTWDWVPQIPVIVWTAHYEERDRPPAYRAGADAYVEKPFAIETLRRLVERLTAMSADERAVRRKDLVRRLDAGEVIGPDIFDDAWVRTEGDSEPRAGDAPDEAPADSPSRRRFRRG